MWFVLSLLAVMVVCAAVIDLRARRRRAGHSGVDGAAVRDARRRNESDLRMRSNDQDFGGKFLG